ncbi:MAG: glycosyltransferase family 39 protein [Sinimarinibacterium flocculans]|uniref:glycosyltransferase family 39 protein n=1 Tax=Sinimarinibacterium flocculans TaxID=985250 RepID=UPI003C42C70B
MNTIAFVSLYGLLFLLIAGFVARRDLDAPGAAGARLHRGWVCAWLVLGALIRLPLLWDTGFHYDTGTYQAWALAASDPADPLGVYDDGVYTDHPPLLMYALAVVGAVVRLLGWETSPHFLPLLKLPALLADAATSLLLVHVLRERLGEVRAVALASLYWFNPVLIFVGAKWGQTDAALCLLVAIGWLAWSRQRLFAAAVAFTAAVAFKPLGLLYALLFFVAASMSTPWRRMAPVLASAVGAYALLVLPFAWGRSLEWLASLYLRGPGQPDYITVNAYNLWALVGWNWQTDVGSAFGLKLQRLAAFDVAAALVAIAVWLGWRLRKSPDMGQRGEQIAWAFVLATVALFMLGPAMRERYILFVLPFAFLLAPDRVRLPMATLWTGTALANIAYVYYFYIDKESVAPHDTAFIRLSAATNLLVSVMTVLWWQIPDWTTRVRRRLAAADLPTLPSALPRERWALKHTVATGGFVLAALAIGLYRVGAIEYPQTGVVGDGFTVEYRYDQPVDARTALIYAGEKAQGDTPARLSLQRFDGGEWVDVLAERDFNDFYHLYEVRLVNPGPSTRYRWRTSASNWRINELALLDLEGRALLPAKVEAAEAAGGEWAALADEPENWTPRRGYLGGVYFDEIYHVRSGYEYLHRLPLYDHTHPPMGKWPIMLSIDLFGMRPFGWRFAGVLTSAITVGVLAWGGWLLVGTLPALLVAGALGLFEFSRFTIGRYGTIDGYLALYVLLSALFLWRRFGLQQWSDWRDGWRPGLDLFVAGAFLGAAIGVKWSALYGGLGVFLFFVVAAGSGMLRDGAARWRRLAPRLLGAALAFGLTPFVVFCLSYIPFLRLMDGSPSLLSSDGVREIIKSQQYIYNYHSNLTDSHPFASAFWTWPINLKPLWIYTGEGHPRTAISILGNPAIWWGGLLVLIAAVWRNLGRVHRTDVLLLGGWASLYLPWALVDRTAFNYHYYPSALLLILLLARYLVRWSQLPRLQALPLYAVMLAGLLFVWFYPTISGHPAPLAWFESLRWLPTWWML